MTSHDLSNDYNSFSEADVSRWFREAVEIGERLAENQKVISETVTEEIIDGEIVRRVVVRKRARISSKDSDIDEVAFDKNASTPRSPRCKSKEFGISAIRAGKEQPPLHFPVNRDVNEDVDDSVIYESVKPYASNPTSQIIACNHLKEPNTPAVSDSSVYEELNRSLFQPSLYESVTPYRDIASHPSHQSDYLNRSQAEDEVLEGEGIKEGTVGQPIQFTLNGRRAGPGQLSCRCRAPSGVMTYVGIHDNKDGTYTVDLNATEPGLHTVEVEWDGQPIPGSPFLVRIMQAPDVKKVRAHGSGLESGLINTFQGVFKVETKGAGPGTLKIRIHGPKGAFKVEMSRDHPKDRTINVKYNPTEAGVYTANVFWSDEHVQGSPFEIFVAQDAEHLRRWENNREQIHRQEGLMNGH